MKLVLHRAAMTLAMIRTVVWTLAVVSPSHARVDSPCTDIVRSIDSDNELDLDEDPDIDFDTQDKDLKPKRKAYEVEFAIYSPKDILAQQDRQTKEVSAIIGQPFEATAILLRYARWNKERLIEQYMDKQEEVLDKAGLGQHTSGPPKIQKVRGFMCDICCDDSPDLQTFALKCRHRFCVDCYRQYLVQKIKEEGEAARIRCPGQGCNQIVDSKSMTLLVTADLHDRSVVHMNEVWMALLTDRQVSGALNEDVRRRQGQS